MDRLFFTHLTTENADLLVRREAFFSDILQKETLFWPFLRPCQVKVLMVVDGLNFSEDGFGLSTFVRTLLDMPGNYVRFRITLADIRQNIPDALMMGNEPRIVRRITGFRFDHPDHFAADMYDEVMLFGIAQTMPGRGTAANGAPYPAERLADPELRVLTEFMNAGGGLFATGDHGRFGRFLCHAVPRARNMRLWDNTSEDNDLNEVSMTGPRRNDTNRIGSSPDSQFDDESDDTPQRIRPRMYSRTNGIFRATFPHPLLCGPNGVIRVMPDHPHEGECVAPANTGLQLNINGPLGPEYPNATGGGAKPVPEVISRSFVLSGTTSGVKDPTDGHDFGGICAYDGHRAGIGRVVTDATWHHFVNINLVGVTTLPVTNPKRFGFLYSAAGQAHFEQIKAYFRNIAVWLAPPPRIRCMNTRLSWNLVWSDRVMEAVLTTTDIRLAETSPFVFSIIGKHARDALGRYASQCQTVRLILDLVLQRAIPKLIPEIDPWLTDPKAPRPGFDGIAWFDGSPLLDISLGAALVAIRDNLPPPDEKGTADLESETIEKVMAEGARFGVKAALESASAASRAFAGILRE